MSQEHTSATQEASDDTHVPDMMTTVEQRGSLRTCQLRSHCMLQPLQPSLAWKSFSSCTHMPELVAWPGLARQRPDSQKTQTTYINMHVIGSRCTHALHSALHPRVHPSGTRQIARQGNLPVATSCQLHSLHDHKTDLRICPCRQTYNDEGLPGRPVPM